MGIIIPTMGIEDILSNAGDALYPRTRQAVLRLFFTRPDRRFLQKEVITQLGLGSGAVQRELDRLWRAQILERTVDGRQTYFQANTASPIFEELRGLVRKTFGVGQLLGAALQQIAPRIKLAFIFGSLAKGTEKSASDVDLLVVSDDITLSDLIPAIRPAEQELGREVNPSLYSTKEFRRKLAGGHNFLTSVVREPKAFLVGGESDLRELAEVRVAENHKTSRAEIAELVAIAERDIDASNTEELHDDWRFNIAYNAALQLANAALAASGFRVEHGGNQHYRSIDSLSLTLGTDSATIKKFEIFRKKRNVSDYERMGLVSESDVREMRAIAEKLRQDFEAWIAKNHPDLKP